MSGYAMIIVDEPRLQQLTLIMLIPHAAHRLLSSAHVCSRNERHLTRLFFLMVLLRLSPPLAGASMSSSSCSRQQKFLFLGFKGFFSPRLLFKFD